MRLIPNHFLLLIGLVFGSLLILSWSLLMDLHLHDTYIVLQGYLLPAFSLLFLVFVWGIYAVFVKRVRSKKLALIHSGLTIFILLFIAILPLLYQVFLKSAAGALRHYYTGVSIERYRNPIYLSELLIVALILLMMVQVLFLFNVRRDKVE